MARLSRMPRPEWPGLLLAGGALAVAHGAQFAGLVPCALCYLERWPYRAAIVLAAVAIVWRWPRPMLRALLLGSFLAAAGLAFVHVGVEARWWKSPLPECAAPVLDTRSAGHLLASLPAHPAKPCDAPTYLVPGVRVSMARMNLAFALAAAAIVAICIGWKR